MWPRLLITGVIAATLAGLSYGAMSAWPVTRLGGIAEALEGNPDNGAYIARMSGCIACHSDFDNGGEVLAGGPALSTSFGAFRAPNITPDPTHGIGDWSLDEFATALRHGVAPDGMPYYPAFPYAFYTKLSDQDVADLWAAIWTVSPVSRPSEPQDLHFPFNLRAGLKLWRGLFFEPTGFTEDPDKGDAWNRGAYIVEGPGHCGACHTPRNFMGAREIELAHHGADGLPGGDKSPPITAEALKREGWTRSDLAFALRSGLTPKGDSFSGAMGEVVRDGTSFLSDFDLDAIAAYLLDE